MRHSIPFSLLLCLSLLAGCASTMSEAEASRRFMEIRSASSNRGSLTLAIDGIKEELGDVRALLEWLAPTATTDFTGNFSPVSSDAVAERFTRP